MKSYRKELWFNTPTRVAFVNITSQVQDCLGESGVKEGLAARQCHAYNRCQVPLVQWTNL